MVQLPSSRAITLASTPALYGITVLVMSRRGGRKILIIARKCALLYSFVYELVVCVEDTNSFMIGAAT